MHGEGRELDRGIARMTDRQVPSRSTAAWAIERRTTDAVLRLVSEMTLPEALSVLTVEALRNRSKRSGDDWRPEWVSATWRLAVHAYLRGVTASIGVVCTSKTTRQRERRHEAYLTTRHHRRVRHESRCWDGAS
jgi:hypothetical protein